MRRKSKKISKVKSRRSIRRKSLKSRRRRSRRDGGECAERARSRALSAGENIERVEERVDMVDQLIEQLEKVKIGKKHIPDKLSLTHKIGSDPEYLLRAQLTKLIEKKRAFKDLKKEFKEFNKYLNKLSSVEKINEAEMKESAMIENIMNFDKELKDLCKKLKKDLEHARQLTNKQLEQGEKNIRVFQKDVERLLLKQGELDAEDVNFGKELLSISEKMFKTKKAIREFINYVECKQKILEETIMPAIDIVNEFCA